ncbi:complex I subunit 4 family protein [Ornithinimicrobium sediminis]|uniref:complex I subunit 4 family protein n=1 Tax=Ornithinimicrobium sediminis TaxID=2904603 RepID=UPI001E48C08E|nr:NADH-quinone oxidoreductase subunit M [Ornithinimicrobium sediminis]
MNDLLWPALALLPLLVTTLALAVADRTSSPPSEPLVRGLSVGSALLSAVGVVGTVLTGTGVDVVWIPALGVDLDLRADGISTPLVLLTAGVGIVATALRHTRPPVDRTEEDRTAPLVGQHGVPGLAAYHACLQLVLLGALVTFLSRDAIVFFVGFELVLLPMWLLVARHGDAHEAARRDGAALRFVLVTATGSTLMLLGILALSTLTGTTDVDRWAELAGASLSGREQLLVAVLLLVGLGLKVPVWPLHTWLPWVHSTAPTAGSVLLAAVLLKMGTYGIVRLVVPVVPEGFATASPVLAGLAVTGIVWAGLACLVERDLKRLIAWSSIAHLGFVVLALATGTETGLQAALFGNVAHGVIAALLFVVVGALKERWGSADLTVARAALREVTPRLGFALVVGMAASMGLPGLAGFWGELGAVYAAWAPAEDRTEGWFRLFAVVAAVGAVIAAAYAVRVLREVWAGDRLLPAIPDSHRVEGVLIGVLVVAVLVLGVYPSLLLDVTAADAAALLTGGVR